jgi:hypothetical protein
MVKAPPQRIYAFELMATKPFWTGRLATLSLSGGIAVSHGIWHCLVWAGDQSGYAERDFKAYLVNYVPKQRHVYPSGSLVSQIPTDGPPHLHYLISSHSHPSHPILSIKHGSCRRWESTHSLSFFVHYPAQQSTSFEHSYTTIGSNHPQYTMCTSYMEHLPNGTFLLKWRDCGSVLCATSKLSRDSGQGGIE